MNFRPELAEAVIAGRKTVTRRAVNPDNPQSPYHPDRAESIVGKRIAICPGRGKRRIGSATVAGVTRELFYPAAIDDREAIREGFDDRAAFKATWLDLHGNVQPVEVWRIELEGAAA